VVVFVVLVVVVFVCVIAVTELFGGFKVYSAFLINTNELN
jgi:hypothetical protein